ncbi:MAG: protease family protein [Verrucomicrobiota bacterium]|jgi:membrane protease YdiL (CAAX protease family)
MSTRTWGERLVCHLQGHVFLFGNRRSPEYDPSAGLRLLLIFVLLEGVIGPRLWLFSLCGLPVPPTWLRVPVLLVLAMVLIRFFAGVRLTQIGLYRWRNWSLTEKSYLIQVFVIANVVFGLLYATRLRMIAADPGLWWRPAAIAVFTSFLWGFHQELVYRGILQTELVRRWGSVVGVLVSNLLFTFGPLHFYHFSGRAPLLMFTAIFVIGLFFGVLFRRSGNLAIICILHGLGNCYIEGLGRLGH